MQVKVVTPEKEIFNGKAKSVNVPTQAGRITVLPHHTELLSIISPGKIIIEYEKDKKEFLTQGGVIEVYDNEVNLLLQDYKNEG